MDALEIDKVGPKHLTSKEDLNIKVHSLARRIQKLTDQEGCSVDISLELLTQCKDIESKLHSRELREDCLDPLAVMLDCLSCHGIAQHSKTFSGNQVTKVEVQLEETLASVRKERARIHNKLTREEQLLIDCQQIKSTLNERVTSLTVPNQSSECAAEGLMEEQKALYGQLTEKMEWFVEHHLLSDKYQGLGDVVKSLVSRHSESDPYVLVASECQAQLLLSCHILERHPLNPRHFRLTKTSCMK